MTNPDDYLDSDYSPDSSSTTAAEITEVSASEDKATIKGAKDAMSKLENDSETYGKRRPFRDVVRARVIR